MICNAKNIREIKELCSNITTFLSDYTWTTDAYISDFFTASHWQRLPGSWRNYFSQLEPPDLVFLLTKESPRNVPPLSLLSFRSCTQAFSLPREIVDLGSSSVISQLLVEQYEEQKSEEDNPIRSKASHPLDTFTFLLKFIYMMESLKDSKSLGERLIRKFSIREKPSGIPLVNRKASKPMTEKRRRDRINKCLVQLKNIIFRAKGKEEKKFARLEKADILEMTIAHLMEVHGHQGKAEDFIMEKSPQSIADVYGCMRRVEAVRDLNDQQSMTQGEEPSIYHAQGEEPSIYHAQGVEPSIYNAPQSLAYPMTPRYHCGNSQNHSIRGVNFGQMDILEEDGIMCGSASRVFVMGDTSESTSNPGRHQEMCSSYKQKIQDKVSPITNGSVHRMNSGVYSHSTATHIKGHTGPKSTSTPLSRPYRTSTPVMGVSAYSLKVTPPSDNPFYPGQGHQPMTSTPLRFFDVKSHERMMEQGYKSRRAYNSFLSPDDVIKCQGQDEVRLDISPDLRTRLFSASSSSPDSTGRITGSANLGSDGDSRSRPSDSSEEYWQPWK